MAKAFVVAAPSSGSGKTMLTLGLLRAFRNRGLRVASAKVGPDHIDPRFHEAASGRPCLNLDPWAMKREVVASLLTDLNHGADLVIVEGVMGLFDGPHGARGSTADLAQDMGLPIVLVLDSAHQGQSIAALAEGFLNHRKGLTFAGLILNRVASDKHTAILTSALASLGVPILGLVRRSDSLNWPSRHLGLVQAQENQELELFIETTSLAVARETKLDKLLTLGAEIHPESLSGPVLPPLGQRIAVADDVAFSFAYPHILHAWNKAGAEISLFSPLKDEAPKAGADAIFLPGGYPELHAGQLSQNQTFLNGLRNSKALIYGECGGFMVLGDALIDAKGQSHPMAGLLPLTTSFANRKLQLGYRQLSPLGGPWTNPLRGHEFHYSSIADEGKADRLFKVSDASGEDLGNIGLKRGNVMGSYAHVICE
ncbi:MAG TPA: cobyrinate a,c-diamide synthase, partial [Aestuariivirga sp.]|nr:cobyrinate a,c-diamide synthase [Aestuariivirga sp.]